MNNYKKQLVIIPGWGGTKESWRQFAEIADKDFEVHILEMPCFGDAPCPDAVWGVEEYAAYVKKMVASFDRPILLGHSFGGQIAVNVVANNPDIFSRLILSGAAIIRLKRNVKRIIFVVIAKIGKVIFSLPVLNKLEGIAKKALYKVVDSPDYDKTAGIKREIFKKIIRQSQENLLPEILVPTLVVWGSKDSYVPLAEGRKISAAISNSEFRVIEGGTHGLHLKHSEELSRIIKEFTDKKA